MFPSRRNSARMPRRPSGRSLQPRPTATRGPRCATRPSSSHRREEITMIVDQYTPIFVISVAAELAEMHPQTLRQYDRLGIVKPNRAPGRSRRYSQHDVDMLREVQRLSHEGVSLEGIRRIMQLENQVEALRAKVRELGE